MRYRQRNRLARRSGLGMLMLMSILPGWPASANGGVGGAPEVESVRPEPLGTDEIRRLVADLGADEFVVRQRATQRLASLGPAAVADLAAARDSSDAEIRQRASYVLAVVQKQQHQTQLEKLRRGEPMAEHDLPGWPTFAAAVGDGPDARELFATILSQEWELIETGLTEPALANDALRTRALRLQRNLRTTDQNAAIGAALLLHCDPKVTLQYNALQLYINLLKAMPRSTAKNLDDPWRRLLAAALQRANDTECTFYFLELGIRHEIPNVMSLAQRVLAPTIGQGQAEAAADNAAAGNAAPGNAAPAVAVQDPVLLRVAMAAVAQFGTTEQIAWLEPHFTDERRCIPDRAPTQVRDLALATVLQLAKEDPQAYGLPPYTDIAIVYAQRKVAFVDDTTRQKAFALWREKQATRTATRDALPPK